MKRLIICPITEVGELSPESLEEFLDIKYNEDAWNKLKSKYDILNQYKIDSGNLSAQEILDLDKKLLLKKEITSQANIKLLVILQEHILITTKKR